MATLVHSLSLAEGSWASDSLRRWCSSPQLNPLANPSLPVVEQLRHSANKRLETFSELQRSLMVDALRRQYMDSGLELSDSVWSILASPRTMVVTTAHQPNWMGGPAYWLHKLLSTIALADKLSGLLPEFQWIPLYWMGSEDHDLAELGHCVVNGKRMEWKGEQGAYAFGRLRVPPVSADPLKEALGNTPYGELLKNMLQESYAPGYTVAQSTRRLAHALLGEGGWLSQGNADADSGLLVLDGDDARLKEAFAPVLRDQVDSPGLAAALVLQRQSELMEDHGVEVDLHIRDWPFFVLQGNERIKPEGKYSADDLRGLDPQQLTPGVVLRPLYQEFSVPSVAFVGGGSEQLYWAALQPLFSHYGIPFPVTMLRPSLAWLTPGISQQWLAMGWTWGDLGKAEHELESKFWKSIFQNNPSISPLNSPISMNSLSIFEGGELSAGGEFVDWAKMQVEALIQPLGEELLKVDAGMQGALGASRHKILQELQRLEQLYRKALRRRFKNEYDIAHKLIQHLMPSGVPMERVEGMWSSLAYGGPAILKVYKDCLSPLELDPKFSAPWMRFIDLGA